MLLVSRMAALCLGMTLFWTEVSAAVEVSAAATAGSKPQFSVEPGQYVQLSASASQTTWKNTNTTFTHSAAKANEPESEWVQASRLSVLAPSWTIDNQNILSFVLASSFFQSGEAYWDSTKTADATLTTSHGFTYKKWNLSQALTIKRNFYKFDRDRLGASNAPWQASMTWGVNREVLDPRLTAGMSYSLIQRRYFTGDEREFYSLSFTTGFQAKENIHVGLGLVTSDAQLSGRTQKPVYAYKSDLSEAYSTVSVKI